jgi:hypothetical protein
MKNVFLCRLAMVAAVFQLLILAGFAYGADDLPAYAKNTKPVVEQTGELEPTVGQGFVVQDLFGGQIFGYDVDHNGTEGMLSEAVSKPGGTYLIATETFSQTTGAILALVEIRAATRDDFVTLGVVGSHIGLREWEHVQGLYVTSRTYNVINPLSGNRFDGVWTPPINDMTQHFEDVEGNQGAPGVAVMASTDTCCSRFVFGSNVAANTFGPTVTLQDPIFTQGVPPLLAYDSTTNQAVLAQAQGAPYSTPQVALVNLTTSNITEFTGLGDGFVNGLAVDSATGIACTTTETDNVAEFYNLATHSGFEIGLPVIGQYSGATVAVDPVNRLFLITHPVPGSPGQIHVYDENGGLVESLRNFMFGPGGAYIALNPSTRTGFVQIPGPHGNYSALQSFTY